MPSLVTAQAFETLTLLAVGTRSISSYDCTLAAFPSTTSRVIFAPFTVA